MVVRMACIGERCMQESKESASALRYGVVFYDKNLCIGVYRQTPLCSIFKLLKKIRLLVKCKNSYIFPKANLVLQSGFASRVLKEWS